MEMKDKYTTAEVAEMFNISDRTVRRHLRTIADSLSVNEKGYTIPFDIIQLIATRFGYELTSDNCGQYDRTEHFTEEEYQEFQKRLIEYPMLLDKINLLINELEYHKKLLEINLKNHNDLISTIKERNYIEAKEKKIDR